MAKLLSDEEVFGSGGGQQQSLLSDEDVFGAQQPAPKSPYSDAIGSIESGNRYDTIGPPTRGKYPIGKHQVMEDNVGPWTQEALGRPYTPQEFLNDPNAQETVFAHKFHQYVDQHGNPDDAASMWFSGRPLAQAGSRSDNLGTTVPDYVRKFRGALGRTDELTARAAPANRPAPQKLLSDDEVFGNTPGGTLQTGGLQEQQDLTDLAAGIPKQGGVGKLQGPVAKPPAAAPAEGGPSAITRGFVSSLIQQNPELTAEFLEGMSHFAPEDLKPALTEAQSKLRGVASLNPEEYKARAGSMWDVKNVDQALTWAGENIGQMVGSSVPSFVMGTGGAMIGSRVGGRLGGIGGAIGGAASASYVQNYGDVYKELKDAKVDPKRAAELAFYAAVPMAALDSWNPAAIITKFGGFSQARKEVARGIASRVLAEAGKGAGREGITEAAQQAVEEATVALETGQPLLTVERGKKVVEAGVAGALGGGVMGAPGGMVRPQVATNPTAEDIANAGAPPPPPPSAPPGMPTSEPPPSLAPSVPPEAAPTVPPAAPAAPVASVETPTGSEMAPPIVNFLQKKKPKLSVIEGGLSETTDPNAPMKEDIEAQPGANLGRLTKLLGQNLYGDPSATQSVSIKEIVQNSFDAVKAEIEKGTIGEGKINIDLDPGDRLIRVTDNGSGMTPNVLANEFLQIAGTKKEGRASSGGLGIAKMQFLFGNKTMTVTTMRDGKVAMLATTGEELFNAMNGEGQKPRVQIRNPTGQDHQLFPEGHGTHIEVSVPEKYRDPSTGEEQRIPFMANEEFHPVLQKSPLFRNIKVKFGRYGNLEELPNTGATFPAQDYTQFANVKFGWGNARLYVTKAETPHNSWDDNLHVLSNGLWQFSKRIKSKPMDFSAPPIQRRFYLDLEPKVRAEDVGYPFDLNRQRFSQSTKEAFDKLFNYVSLVFQRQEFSEEAQNFGDLQYLHTENGKVVRGDRLQIKPKEKPADTPITLIKEGDQIEVKDGKLIVNGRVIPELTPDQLEKFRINSDDLIVDQSEIDPLTPIIHDNTSVKISELEERPITDLARERYGDRFDDFMYRVGDLFGELKDIVAGAMGYPGMAKEGHGISFDPGYRGVSIRLPFAASFINVGGTEYADVLRGAVGMVGTMVHELAHHKVRSHDADFPAEMQRILIALDTHPEFDFHDFKQRVVNEIQKNEDIFKYLHDVVLGGNFDISTRGKRFSDTGANEARDASPPRNMAEAGSGGEGQPSAPIRGLGGLGATQAPARRSEPRLRIERTRPLSEEIDRAQRIVAQDGEDKGIPGEAPQPETDSAKNVIHVAFGKGRGGPGAAPPGIVASGVHADRMNRFYKWMLGLDRLVDRNPNFAPLLRYYEKIMAMHRDESKIQDMAVRIAKQWRRLGAQSENLAALIDDITNMVYRSPMEVRRGATRHPTTAEFGDLVRKHAVSKEALAVYDKVKKSFDVFLSAIESNAFESAKRIITDPKKLADTIDGIRSHIAELRKRPYFPFMRFGTHYVTVKDPTGKVTFFTTVERRGVIGPEGMQKRVASKLEASLPAGHTIETGKMPESAAPFVGLPAELLESIAQELSLTPDQTSALEQLRYDMSPAASFKHRFQHKDYTPGYSYDFLRAYSRYFFHGARYFSKTKYASSLRDDLKAARAVGGNKADSIADYMDDHFYKTVMESKGDYGLFKGAIFLWTFGYSIAGAALNLTQVPMVSGPFLAAKFGGIGKGDARATKALVKAMTDVTNFYKKGAYDNSSEFEMRAISYGIKTSRITEAQASELAGLAQGNNLLSLGNNKASRMANWTLEKAAFFFEMAEQFNRRVTYRAALDLAMQHPDAQAVKDATTKYADEYKNMIDTKEFTPAEASAVITAVHATEQTQFVYGKYARPRFMRGRLAGTVFVFKHYMLSMLYLMGANKSDVAPRMLIMMLALSGMMGMPGAEDIDDIINVLAKWLFGKDFRVELAVREFIKDHANGTVPADVVLHGLARRGFGVPAMLDAMGSLATGRPGRGLGPGPGQNVPAPTVDMSRSLGMGRLLPFEIGKVLDPNDPTKALSEQGQKASGAIFGLGFNFYKFLTDKDHSWTDAKRWEKAIPRALAGVSRAYRAFSEGRERSGPGQESASTLLRYDTRDPEQMAEIVSMGMGFMPTRQTAQWDLIRARTEVEEGFKTSRTMLLRQFDEARLGGIDKEREKVIQSIRDFNKDLPPWAKGFSISSDTIRESVQTRARTRNLREMGLPAQKSGVGTARHIQELFPESTVDVRRLPR